MSRKRTALEYLIEEYQKHCDGDGLIPFEIIELAKDMEKQQIKQAWQWGVKHEICAKNAEQYYNETFKQ
jgi:hypothetical protein